ncbi:hypothetical protein SUGI_0464830 [Cryptomeria japonica]|uniref:probable 6-phosphogluconolactonase 4, chloroplastic isoform X1 n=1 Tax=Cryptomeria japonica TaxID=3369 RepID=UPI002408AB0E|nr:probable 6-phosphogluconolactonase 4, chloroplastic isoform X1 [Cryptomeria japonica]GLJ24351.1 hypothetical protein SUGI_0464830 [Cryptomeria japonica]
MESLRLCNTRVGLSYSPSLHVGQSHMTIRHLSDSGANTSPTSKLFKHWNAYSPSHTSAGITRLLKHTVKKGKNKISVSMGDSVAVSHKDKGDLNVFPNGDELAASLADYVAGMSQAITTQRGAFTVVLSGGSLINALRKLTEPPYLDSIDWGRWHVFWVDERVVKIDHPDSNYKLAYDNFLAKVPIVPGHVYAINDSLSPEAAAEDYETGLRQLVKTGVIDVSKDSGLPKFDLMLLGIGPDGHIASLFPGHPLLNEKEKWVTSIIDSPKPPPERITFTLPVINSAANVAVVVTGAGKADPLKRVFDDEQHGELLPVQMLSPKDKKPTWFTDKEAAAKIVN